ncbi:hypothetical protein [Microbacterium sp. Bi98]|uniref:hypothetical protein n=1 Tax=Microbacterium sp. Bi98 TaxID=2821116 RepID=UPI001E3EEF95|nr:hypothetical protein [Microbacterium sp. Bi98]
MDLVCAYDGSELVYVTVDGVPLPDRCSNAACPYSEAGSAWTVERSRLQLQLED